MEEKYDGCVQRPRYRRVSAGKRRRQHRRMVRVRIAVGMLAVILASYMAGRIIPVLKNERNRDPAGSLSMYREGQTEPVFYADDSKDDSTVKYLGQETDRAQKKDTESPTISGVRPILSYTNEAIDYEKGIQVTDNRDMDIALQIDTSKVDPGIPGTYPVIYRAIDHAGNISEADTTVSVCKQQGGTTASSAIMEQADEILSTILVEGMTEREQVEGIYTWLRKHCLYSGHSERTDYMQAGYVMLHGRAGDCFGFYAASKLLFERLGISNMDVVKIKNDADDSEHFWSLVSLDEGQTWYHFDATPRYGDGDDFCLVTDEFLDSYSESHHGSHHRDKSLYPKTPEV